MGQFSPVISRAVQVAPEQKNNQPSFIKFIRLSPHILSGWWCNNHLEKWWSSSMGRMTSHIYIYNGKTCLKPPTSCYKWVIIPLSIYISPLIITWFLNAGDIPKWSSAAASFFGGFVTRGTSWKTSKSFLKSLQRSLYSFLAGPRALFWVTVWTNHHGLSEVNGVFMTYKLELLLFGMG